MGIEDTTSVDNSELSAIREELATIRIALSVLAMNKLGAADAAERKRHEQASTRALDLLIKRLEDI